MSDKSFFVVNLGSGASDAVHIEAEVFSNSKAKIVILSSGRNPKKLFEWTVTEEEVESLQNLFIFLRNELGRNRLSDKINESLQKDKVVDENEQRQIL